MRETDEAKPPEAVEREEREAKANLFGVVVAGGGVVVVVLPVVVVGDLKLIPALAGIALVLLGGLLMDRKTFLPVLERVIDVLPWGKKS